MPTSQPSHNHLSSTYPRESHVTRSNLRLAILTPYLHSRSHKETTVVLHCPAETSQAMSRVTAITNIVTQRPGPFTSQTKPLNLTTQTPLPHAHDTECFTNDAKPLLSNSDKHGPTPQHPAGRAPQPVLDREDQ
ncbi:hypothetical protein FPOAC2_02025 [Fusarium poae]